MKKSNFIPISFLVFLILTLPLSVFLVGQRWLLPRAVGLPSPIIFGPTSGEFPVGATFSAKISLNTEGQPIEGLDLVVVAHNLEISAQKSLLPNNLFYQKEPEIFKGILKLSVLSKPEGSFSNNTPLDLVNLTLRGRVSCQNASLTVDKNLSVVAAGGQNMLGEPVIPKFTIQTPAGIINPAFTSPATAPAVLNQDFLYTATATNPNNGTLAFSFYNLPDFLTANGPNLSGKPDKAGSFTIDAEVIDNKGGSACQALNLTVYDPAPIEISEIRAIASHDTATVSWKTNREATSQVEYGKTESYGKQTTKDETLVKNHAQTFWGLDPLTTYHFRVKSTAPGTADVVSPDLTFTTDPPPQKVLYLKFQFQGKSTSQNNHELTLKVKGKSFAKKFFGNADGTASLSLGPELPNSDVPYELALKGYQNLQIVRKLPILDGRNPRDGFLDFNELPCGDIAPAGNTDNLVNSLDWAHMATEWNIDNDRESIADINDDLRVNSLDYSLMVSRFGQKGDE
jgi:hypothetical protein